MVKRKTPQFIPGLELNRKYFQQVVRPLLDKHFPHLLYSAGIVGEGSDVLGFDSPQSMDHNWGPQFRLFLTEEDYHTKRELILDMFRAHLPHEFMGFPTNFTKPNEKTYLVTRMHRTSKGPVNPLHRFYTTKFFFEHFLGVDPYKDLTEADWLILPQQALLEVTAGELYHDGLGIQRFRDKFAYFPEEIWKYIYLSEWDYLANIEAYVGRSASVGDDVGSTLISARIVNHLMNLAFLQEKKYIPYEKWYGTAFSRLKSAHELTYPLTRALHAYTVEKREMYLGEAYTIIARRHNELKLTKPIKPVLHDYHGRPFQVLGAARFITEIFKTERNPFLKNLKYRIGHIDQFVAHTRINQINYAHLEFRKIIK